VRNETSHKCAGNQATDCMETKRRYVNCMFKIRTYLKINDEHDALSPEYLTFKKMLQEEKRRTRWEDVK